MRKGVVAVLGAMVAATAISANSVAIYTITDLGLASSSPDGDFPTLAINNNGIVAGQTTTDWFTYHGFVYSQGVFQSFGAISTSDNFAEDINDHGVLTAGPSIYQYSVSGISLLGTLPDNGFGVAINNKNEVAGFRPTPDGTWHATLYTPAGQRYLGSLGGRLNLPYDINNKSQIVGFATVQNNTAGHAFLASPNAPMVDLGTLGGRDSRAFGINDRGEIVGYSNVPQGPVGFFGHAFLYSPSAGMKDLGTLGGALSMADAINNRGHIVGMAQTSTGELHAFLYAAGTMFDLNTWIDPSSGWVLYRAVDINDHGQIVCFGYMRDDGTAHSLLLIPVVH